MATRAKRYPFAFFEHGKLNVDVGVQAAEGYVVFSRDATVKERARIMSACPPPMLGGATWGRRFVYVDSGDGLDLLVLATFGGAQATKLLSAGRFDEANTKLPRALRAFSDAYEAWLVAANAVLPIAFAVAPMPTICDSWGKSSQAEIGAALSALQAIREAEVDAAPTRTGKAARNGERERIAECLGWIEADVQRLAGEAPAALDDHGIRIATAAKLLEALDVPVDHFGSVAGSELDSAAAALAKALNKSKPERRASIASLSPRAQLVYAASQPAKRNGDLVAFGEGDFASALDHLAEQWPAREQWRAATLMAAAAFNLAATHMDKPDRAASRAALPLMRRAIARGARTTEHFHRALDIALVASDASEVIALGHLAIDSTGEAFLSEQAEQAARKLGDIGGAKVLATKRAALLASSAAAQSADLERCAAHLEQGGAFTNDLLGNTAVLYRRLASPDAAKVAAHVERMRDLLLREVAFGFHDQTVLGFAIMASTHGHADAVVDVLDELIARGFAPNGDLLWTLAGAGIAVRDGARKRRVVELVTPWLGDRLDLPFVHACLACVHVALGDSKSALASLARSRESHPRFQELRSDEALRPLHGTPAFEALFGSAERTPQSAITGDGR